MFRSLGKTILPLLILALLAASLSGCVSRREKKAWLAAAEDHLAKLQEKVGSADHFTLQSKEPYTKNPEWIFFYADSEKYGDSFSLRVYHDDSLICEDNYYRLYLRQETEDRVNAIMNEALKGNPMKAVVSFIGYTGLRYLSLSAADALDDFLKMTEDKALIKIQMDPEGTKRQLSAGEIYDILLAMSEEGFYAEFYPYQSDSVFYTVTKAGVWRTKMPGADGGAMLEREEIVMTRPASEP